MIAFGVVVDLGMEVDSGILVWRCSMQWVWGLADDVRDARLEVPDVGD